MKYRKFQFAKRFNFLEKEVNKTIKLLTNEECSVTLHGHHKELYWGTFSRAILLPQEIEIEDAEAIEKHGLLIIRLPKLDKNRQAKVRVKNNSNN
jgi:HSP20 family molecular chaperone IbpA